MSNNGAVERTTDFTSEIISGNSSHVTPHIYMPMATDDGRLVWDVIFSVVLTGTVGVLGSTANIINIVVFFKQGFDDSVNISLLGLSISDLCSLTALTWRSILLNPLFQHSDISFDSMQIQYLTAGWPHACFVRITSCITAFITLERCVCIALPMKIKNIITPKRTLIIVVCIFLFLFTIVSPIYFTVYFTQSFRLQLNRTLYILSYINDAENVQNVTFSITVFIQFSSFVIVVTCTIILIHNLRIKSQWRNKSTSALSTNSNLISARDKRVQKMVTIIASIFVVCLLPSCVGVILVLHLSPEFSSVGLYQKSYNMTWATLKMIEGVNSSVSVLVYYQMSSKFRSVANDLFGIIGPKRKDHKIDVL